MEKTANEKEVCFILCSNNAAYTEECIHYIRHLNVPEDFSIDVLAVEDAVSMTAGYNEAMRYSQAKYKVYLHQDTFIINPDFIQDFLSVFQQDERIGMIGVIGAPKLPYSGIMWEGERCGVIYSSKMDQTIECRHGLNTLTEVEAVDGLLMITQYDIPWREDLFDKWDFYDCSQSFEFIRRGYKVVVPRMQAPWCLHDSGAVSLDNYETERWKFISEYYPERNRQKEKNSGQLLTVAVTSHDRKEILQNTVKLLEKMPCISNIIIVDNGSDDETAEWLSQQRHEYIRFDEGIQGYGQLWNFVIRNFNVSERIVFLEAGVYFEEACLDEMIEALSLEQAGIVCPVSNHFFSREYEGEERGENHKGNKYRKSLAVNWTMWAIRKEVFDRSGYFESELKSPESVLLDYSLRLMLQGRYEIRCLSGFSHENLGRVAEVYNEGDTWETEDRVVLKNKWRMNYFNVRPNFRLVELIQEEREKEFNVLEVGCDLGATLLEIQNRYPKCKIYGQDINESAIRIAKKIADVRYGNLDKLEIPFSEKFDYIIFGDVLEHLRDPESVIKICRSVLKKGGYVLASVPNIMHISVLEELLEGRFTYRDTGILDRTHIHFFTYYELMEMWLRAGYQIEDVKITNAVLSPHQKELKEVLQRLSEETKQWMFEAVQYVVKVRMNESNA